MINELRCYVPNKLRRYAKFPINSAKHIATEFIKSNKLRYASPVKRVSKINLLCKQKSSRITMSKQLGDKVLSISNLSELNENKKHQIRIEKSKIKWQKLRYQRHRVNQLYAKDQGKVFRKFREAIKKDQGNEKPVVPQFNNDQL